MNLNFVSMKKTLNVVVYPCPITGAYPNVSASEVIEKVEISEETHENDFFTTYTKSTKNKTVGFVDNALVKKQKTEIVLWNQMPEKEISKLLKYDLEKMGHLILFSINHNVKSNKVLREEKKILPEEIKWESLLKKKRR